MLHFAWVAGLDAVQPRPNSFRIGPVKKSNRLGTAPPLHPGLSVAVPLECVVEVMVYVSEALPSGNYHLVVSTAANAWFVDLSPGAPIPLAIPVCSSAIKVTAAPRGRQSAQSSAISSSSSKDNAAAARAYVSLRHVRAGALMNASIKEFSVPGDSTGTHLWDASLYLARVAISCPESRVIELGSGCGLPGIVACSIATDPPASDSAADPPGLRTILLTDSSEDALELLQENLTLNEANPTLARTARTSMRLPWGTPEVSTVGKWDLALCSDVLYSYDTHAELIDTLGTVLSATGRALIAYRRRCDLEEQFFGLADQRGWEHRFLHVEGQDGWSEYGKVRLFELRRKT
jgi:predicted nicotinamide N-methyase